MKHISTILAFMLTFGTLSAQKDAKDILDATARRLTEEKGVQASFKAEIFNDGDSQGYTMGTMYFYNNKHCITTTEIMTWFDGVTQWSYLTANEEVNISTPTPEEIENMNPYTFINLYKSGYKLEYKEDNLRGKKCYEVRLTAKSKKKNVSTMIVNIDKADYSPLCIRMYDKKADKWTRIAIYDFKSGLSLSDEDFKFNTKDFPNAEIIDLR